MAIVSGIFGREKIPVHSIKQDPADADHFSGLLGGPHDVSDADLAIEETISQFPRHRHGKCVDRCKASEVFLNCLTQPTGVPPEFEWPRVGITPVAGILEVRATDVNADNSIAAGHFHARSATVSSTIASLIQTSPSGFQRTELTA